MQEDLKKKDAAAQRRIDHEYSRSLPGILAQCRVSLLVTTYQAGKLVVVSARPDGQGLDSFFSQLHQPNGSCGPAAGRPGGPGDRDADLATAATCRGSPRRLDPPGEFDACSGRAGLITRVQSTPTRWRGSAAISGLSTRCFRACARWTASTTSYRGGGRPFVSALAAEDRCHLNG